MALVPNWIGKGGQTAVAQPVAITRHGYEFGVPRDSENTGGTAALTAQQQRRDTLNDYLDLYITCPWVNTPINTIARRITAGGVELAPVKGAGRDNKQGEPPRTTNVERLDTLLRFVNPTEDAMQFFRRILTELLIFADSYLEVGWLMGEPVAMWGLDPLTVVEDCDEHGVVTGYRQVMDDGREVVNFEPHEVIHFSLDAPRGGQYGISPVQMAMIPATAWLWNETCIKEAARRGYPPRLHADFPHGTAIKEVDSWSRRIFTKVMGAKNIGQPYTTTGGATLKDLQPNNLLDMLKVREAMRDECIAVFGTSPATVNIIETGNLGGGTGESQDKNLRVNTAVPLEAIVLEKLNYHIVQVGFGVTDWRIRFGEIDYRDSKTVADIQFQRTQSAAYTVNRWRQEIGEPDVPGGDDPFLMTRQGPVFMANLADYTGALMAGLEAKAAPPTAPGTPGQPAVAGQPAQKRITSGGPKNSPGSVVVVVGDPKRSDYAAESAPDETMRRLEESFNAAYRKRRKRTLAESARAVATVSDGGTDG